MAPTTAAPAQPHRFAFEAKLQRKPGKGPMILFVLVLLVGCGYSGMQLAAGLVYETTTSAPPLLLVGLALIVALAFEFVNGFHDTANAVATVIYTHTLGPHAAVLWSGAWNFMGVLTSSGAVAYGIIALLPAELVLQVDAGAGFAMVFALLTAAIIWNLGTWWLGLPASSSHTLIGSIIGVGLANQLLAGRDGLSGVDWAQAAGVGRSLLISPIVGFVCAGGLLLLAKRIVKDKRLYEAPAGAEQIGRAHV